MMFKGFLFFALFLLVQNFFLRSAYGDVYDDVFGSEESKSPSKSSTDDYLEWEADDEVC